jgi:hypothetical protein
MSRPGEELTEFWFEQAASETAIIRGPGISVVFRQGRGLVHTLRVEAGSSTAEIGLTPWRVQATSVPDQEVEQFDARRIGNPFYQELVLHELAVDRGRGICVLLTGSCFDHHFSAVFSLGRDKEAPDRVVFDIDVADRCRGPVEKLAATYVVSCADAAIETRSTAANSLVWGVAAGDLELVALPPARILDPSSGSEGLKVQVQARIDPNTHTHRLHYRWRWASCPDLSR